MPGMYSTLAGFVEPASIARLTDIIDAIELIRSEVDATLRSYEGIRMHRHSGAKCRMPELKIALSLAPKRISLEVRTGCQPS
jgi:hypothetical protein